LTIFSKIERSSKKRLWQSSTTTTLNVLKKNQKLRSLARGKSVPGRASLNLARWRKTMNNLMIELSWLITILLWPDALEDGALQKEPVVALSHYPIHGPLKSRQKRF
jgi:hypothetical protein